MTDADFLDAIVREPYADVHRLVLCDWWDENGQPQRAEFCRVQVELASGRGCSSDFCDGGEPDGRGGVYEHTCGWSERLRRRERELREKYAPVWFAIPGLSACSVWDHEPTIRWFPEGDSRGVKSHVVGGEARRGFVAHVTLGTAAFLGVRCGRCDGAGHFLHFPDAVRRVPCPACRGTGRTEGHAAALARACPLEGVTLANKSPAVVGRGAFVWWWRHVNGTFADYYTVPAELKPYLEGEPVTSSAALARGLSYPTEAAAHAALSDACVRYARAAAGLPVARIRVTGSSAQDG